MISIITSGSGVRHVYTTPLVKRDGTVEDIENALAHDFVKHGFCEFDAKGRCRVVEPNMLKAGEVIDCGTDDDAQNLRNLQRVIATYLDGHTIRVKYTDDWFLVDDATAMCIGLKFKRESRTDEAGR